MTRPDDRERRIDYARLLHVALALLALGVVLAAVAVIVARGL